MFRICFCCCLLLLTTSCVSNGAQNVPNFPQGENPTARTQPDTERLSARVSTPTHVAEAAAPAEPDNAAHILSELEAAAAALPRNVRTVFPYKVATAEKSVPTIIAILDYDEHNQPVFSANVTATRLLTGMLKQGFSRIGLDEYAELAEADESVLLHAVHDRMHCG